MIQLTNETFACRLRTLHASSATKVPTAHSDLRICYIEAGSADWCIDGHSCPVGKGDIILLNDTQKRHFTAFSPGFAVRILILKRQAFANGDHLSFFHKLVLDRQNILRNPELLSLLEALVLESKRKLPNYQEMMSVRLTEFFIAAERLMGYIPEKATGSDLKMRQILSYIDVNIGQNLTLSQLADMSGLTESSFSRAFAKANGTSFRHYLMTRRVEQAISLLETTDKNVIDVAFECGFSSISGFYAAFRKITGTTPREIARII